MIGSPTASPFDSAARYYDAFRAPYAPEALDHLVHGLRLGRDDRVLDLGCGPGTVAIPLSRVVGEVVAVDPSAAMLAEGRRLAAARGAGSIRWIHRRAEDLGDDVGRFRVAIMGQSFHWMDRDLVLRRLGEFVLPGGGLAILNWGARSPQESWEPVAAEIVARFLGARRRHPLKHAEVDHAPSLRRSAWFSEFAVREFPIAVTRDIASILGCVYSGVGVSRTALGKQADAFETDLRAALLEANPSGVFKERVETAVFIAPRAAAAKPTG